MYALGLLIGGAALLVFAIWEYWNDKNEVYRHETYKPEGDWDWWESAVAWCVAMTPLAILHKLGVVSIMWLP